VRRDCKRIDRLQRNVDGDALEGVRLGPELAELEADPELGAEVAEGPDAANRFITRRSRAALRYTARPSAQRKTKFCGHPRPPRRGIFLPLVRVYLQMVLRRRPLSETPFGVAA
jgi:hypothetical protein